jgi:hypothetical protein
MCEISSGQTPFANLEHGHYLAVKIVKAKRNKTTDNMKH